MENYWHLYTSPLPNCPLFRDEIDKMFFLNRIALCKQVHKIKVYVYCLMDNHIHILVSGDEEAVSAFFLDLKKAYGKHLSKHKMTINVDLSEFNLGKRVVTDEEDFRNVTAYILRNPWAAGMGSPLSYKWSSWFLYFNPWVELFRGVSVKKFGKCKAQTILETRMELPESLSMFEGIISPVCWCDYRKVEEVFVRSKDYFKLLSKWGLDDEEDQKIAREEWNSCTDTELIAKINEFCSMHGVSSVNDLTASELRDLSSTATRRWRASKKQVTRLLGNTLSIGKH